MKIALLAAALLATTPLAAQTARQPPFTVQETGRSYWRLADAVQAIGARDGTIAIQPGTYRDCAIQTEGRIAYRAVRPGAAILDGGVCEGKAALVLRGADALVDGLVFTHMRVPDGNGAGIRLEHGGLTVTGAVFRDSEEGILTADDPRSTIRIERSTFSGLGRCDRGLSCAHGIYVGDYGALIVTRSRFERGRGGHYLKSRAARIEATDNAFDDSAGRATNYMIDLSAGATGTIARNIFVQGADKENHSALIAVAAEARDHPSAGLAIAGNEARLAPGIGWTTIFVADWSHEPLKLSGNRLGPGIAPFEVRN